MNDLNNNKVLNSELNIVYRYLLKLGVSKEDAEDVVQETAYKYLLYYDSIKTNKIRSWLIRVALNFYYDQCRKQNRYDLNVNLELLIEEKEALPEEVILKKERNTEVGDALSRLKPYFQEILLLKYQSGLSYNDISKLLDINISSVKTNLFRARKKLEKAYKEVTHER